MGLGGIHIWHLLILLVIVMMVFGTKRLGSLGSDLGNAIKGFRNAMNDEKDKGRSSEPDKVVHETKTDIPPRETAETDAHRNP
jgi:sec-independent protein translocase protein TatA